jgi:sensor domain CHASE-containing protein
MSDVLVYIKNNPQETQRLVGLKYEQLEQLINQALALHIRKQQEMEAKKVRIINKPAAFGRYAKKNSYRYFVTVSS